MARVLVTGAGGPAGVAVIRSLFPKALLALAIVAALVVIREVFFV
jgi:hypothetical protein